MPTEAKRAAVAALKEELSNSTATIVADYRGLTVSEIGAVRRALRGEGIKYRVVKNRLAKIAAKEAGRDELTDLFEGPTAIAMASTDEVTLARVFLDAIRPYKTVVVRGAVIGDRRIDANSVTRLATLPSRDVLLAQLAGGMASPLASLASLFSAPLRNLGYAFMQLVDRKGQEAGAAATATAAPEAAAISEATAVPEESPAADGAGSDVDTAAEATESESPSAEAEAPQADASAADAPEAEAQAEHEVEAQPEPGSPAPEQSSESSDEAEPATESESN